MGALAESERDLIRDRTNASLAAARARGRVGGRLRRLAINGKVALARRLFADPNHSIPEICSTFGISRSTLYRYVKETKQKNSRTLNEKHRFQLSGENSGSFSLQQVLVLSDH